LRRALSGQPVRNYVDGQHQKSLLRLRQAALDLFEWAQNDGEIDMEFIKDLHEKLCEDGCECAGRYRKRDTSPGVYHLDVVPQGSISYYFHRLIDMWNEELQHINPIRAAAIMHWEFMRCFPFDEKTGMVGRLLMNAVLIRGGYPPAIIHQMERQTYFGALDGRREALIPVLVDAIRATIECAGEFSSHNHRVEQRQAAY
jgi:Fic family protein